jgi:hypothetical protein
MFMARSSERLSADAYTRASVERYLEAAAEQRARIELAIAEAEQRRDRALEIREWLDRRGPEPETSEEGAPPGPDATGGEAAGG